MWLGMNDLQNEGTFVLNSSNEPVNYTNWKPTEPNGGVTENCLSFWDQGPNWNDLWCDSKASTQPMCEQILVG